jgi:hypothetical protein
VSEECVEMSVGHSLGRSTPFRRLTFFKCLFFIIFFIFFFFIFFNFLINYPFPGLLSRLALFSDNDRFLASEEGKYGFTLCPGPKNDCKYGI